MTTAFRTDNRVATLETAKAEFEATWRQWLAWAKLGEKEWRDVAALRRLISTFGELPLPSLVPSLMGLCQGGECFQ